MPKSDSPVTEETLEKVSTMLELAEQIVEELKSAETVEVESDAQASIKEALTLARLMKDEADNE